MFPMGLILFYYMYVLSGSVNVFYFPAPYQDPINVFVSLTSYIPFLLLLLIFHFYVVNYILLKDNSWGFLAKGLFAYRRFYEIFN